MRGQWWIPVIAIVLATSLAIAIDRLPGGSPKDDVKLDLSQRGTSTVLTIPEETTTTFFEDTTIPPEAESFNAVAGVTATRTPVTRSRSTTGTTRGTSGGGTSGGGGSSGDGSTGTTAGTTATTAGGSSTTAPGSPGSREWCAKQGPNSAAYDYCQDRYGGGGGGGGGGGSEEPEEPPTTRTTRRTSTTDPDF